jgi:hypothetical protein
MQYINSMKKWTRAVILFLTAFVGVGAVGGAACMIIDPTGGLMGMEPLLPYFQKLPLASVLFQSFLFPGISLLIVNGLSNLTAFVLILREKKAGYVLGWVFGITLILWICIQLWLFAPDVPTLDVIFLSVGIVQLIVGYMAFVYFMQARFQQSAAAPLQRLEGSREIVVYFSRMGYTRRLAEEKAQALGCDILPLTTPEHTAGILGFWWCGRFGMHRWGMPIAPVEADLSAYETVHLFTPVWVFHICGPVRQFLTDYGGKIRSLQCTIVHFNPVACRGVLGEVRGLMGEKLTRCASFCSHFGICRELSL